MDEIVTIRLDAGTAEALRASARRANRSKSEIVRDALAKHLASTSTSCLQGLAKYAGSMRGPADLSTNRRHLAGLGRRKRR